VTFVPAGFPFKWEWSYQSDSVHLTLPAKFMSQVSRELSGVRDNECPDLRPLFRIHDQELSHLLRRLRQESSDHALGKDLITSSLLMLIAGRLHRLSQSEQRVGGREQDTGRFDRVDQERCVQLLNDRLHERISLSELATEFKLSPYHFSRLFKKATGFPPHEYQLQVRIARARVLLRNSPEKNLAHIACELGFSDESHFRRHFKRIVGVTPGRFRSQQ
jgi:AraC family transcriptional regulator